LAVEKEEEKESGKAPLTSRDYTAELCNQWAAGLPLRPKGRVEVR
jgi:hypothetical protein